MRDDITTIGAECFTNGTVICYKGENYTRQPEIVATETELDELPGGSIIRDAKGAGWQKYNKISEKPAWVPATRQEGFYYSANLVEAGRTPVAVLHVGESPND